MTRCHALTRSITPIKESLEFTDSSSLTLCEQMLNSRNSLLGLTVTLRVTGTQSNVLKLPLVYEFCELRRGKALPRPIWPEWARDISSFLRVLETNRQGLQKTRFLWTISESRNWKKGHKTGSHSWMFPGQPSRMTCRRLVQTGSWADFMIWWSILIFRHLLKWGTFEWMRLWVPIYSCGEYSLQSRYQANIMAKQYWIPCTGV